MSLGRRTEGFAERYLVQYQNRVGFFLTQQYDDKKGKVEFDHFGNEKKGGKSESLFLFSQLLI